MILLSNIAEAFRAVRANFLRTVLTILIIASGLTALIGVLTSIDGIKFWFANSFIRLGANTFSIENYTSNLRSSQHRRNRQFHAPITYKEASSFREDYGALAPVSVVGRGTLLATGKFKNKSTQANLQLMGTDENFVLTDNYDIELGRNFNANDLKLGRKVIIIGDEARNLLYGIANPLGKMIYMNGKGYRIIGTFARIGSQGPMGGDKMCIIPATTLMRDYPDNQRSFSLHIKAPEAETLDNFVFEAVGTMRKIRGLPAKEKNDFGIIKVEAILDNFMKNMRFLTWSATIISIITLFSAAIGLMNIMLVSVTERTREIGIRKAAGATRSHILAQFLTEAAVITQLGGLVGIFFGVMLGNLVGLLLGSGFMIPWNWVLGGFFLCFLVGIAAGIYPARKAARLDPIESLRYE